MRHVRTRGNLKRVMCERAKAIMDKRGWSASDVARRANTSRSNVYSVIWPSKGAIPNSATLVVVAKGLGCTVGHLLGEDAIETLPALPDDTEAHMAEWLTAFREVDAETIAKLQFDLSAARAEATALRTSLASTGRGLNELKDNERALQGDITLMRGMVDELKAAKKSLLDKLENAARERRSAEQKYFVLAEACEKAVESPTWVAAQRGYLVSQDNTSAIRRALNKNPLSDIPPANNVKAELADGTVLAKPANGAA